jgi:3-deoxy-D-arabino-heptulosonate 7-phosphate (DAHP) synthase class II
VTQQEVPAAAQEVPVPAAGQQPAWPDPAVLDEVVAELRTRPPLVVASSVAEAAGSSATVRGDG